MISESFKTGVSSSWCLSCLHFDKSGRHHHSTLDSSPEKAVETDDGTFLPGRSCATVWLIVLTGWWPFLKTGNKFDERVLIGAGSFIPVMTIEQTLQESVWRHIPFIIRGTAPRLCFYFSWSAYTLVEVARFTWIKTPMEPDIWHRYSLIPPV